MNSSKTIIFSVLLFLFNTSPAASQPSRQQDNHNEKAQLNTRIDNNRYWKMKAEQGLARLNPVLNVPAAKYTGSNIDAFCVVREDSPDIPVTTENSTQSENSIFINPNDILNVLNSNNSSAIPASSFYGANDFYSFNGGETWEGELEGAGGQNSGDPVALIGNNGWYYVGYITNGFGQGISYSQDQGSTWERAVVSSGGLKDKNHLWIDNCLSSPYEGYLYDAWTEFDWVSPDENDIVISRSADAGLSWSPGINISSAVNAGSHNQGVNIKTGPDGEAYAVWTIYESWPSDESAMGMARSFDGGASWEPATRIIENIRGIRTTKTSKDMRVNSFPSMATDISRSQYNGNLYVVWANIGEPGINEGPDIDVYIIRSEDKGVTWGEPVKINRDEPGLGKEHYFPWIDCDPESGTLSVIFYDDRNVNPNQCEVYCAVSYDAGETWEDFKVSDVSFTPSPIPGLADSYMGDYLGISSRGGMVYPVWTDNRSGVAMAYVSPFETIVVPGPSDLTAEVEFETGNAILNWSFINNRSFSYFNIYRDQALVGTTIDTFFIDALPDYGVYNFNVTAFFDPEGESNSVEAGVQWGDAQIMVNPPALFAELQPDSSVIKVLNVSNTGQLPMDYEMSIYILADAPKYPVDYCDASGGCDEYISRVQLDDIDNSSGCEGYEDYTNLSTTMVAGNAYALTITNGNPNFTSDECGVWIDWNQNGDFTDDQPVIMEGSPGFGPYTAIITPQYSALSGSTRMRARIDYFNNPEPCGTTSYGEVEDYTIDVISWLRIFSTSGNIPAGETAQVEVGFYATGLEIGSYEAELTLHSNDPDNPVVVVPVSLLVSEFAVSIIPSSDTVCSGGSVLLTTEITGGSGSYTYNWTSLPPGFSSVEANPVVSPDSTTIYMVQITDDNLVTEAQATIYVNALPVVDLGGDRELCAGDSLILDAGEHVSYLWNTGDNSREIIVSEAGWYRVEVTNEHTCEASDSVYVTEYPYPEVNLGQDTTLCYYHDITLDAGNPGASYIWSTGETSQTIRVDTAGMSDDHKSLWVDVSYGTSCLASDTFNINFSECLGIYENDLTNIRIYPNPNNGTFYIEGHASKEDMANISLVNPMGSVIYQRMEHISPGHFSIRVSSGILAEGIYTLRITNINGLINKIIVIRK